MTVLPAKKFPLEIKKIMLVPDGILVPIPIASRPISFTNKFPQMNIVGILIRYLYSRDGVYKAFAISAAQMEISVELKLGIFINTGKKDIVSGVVSTPVSML